MRAVVIRVVLLLWLITGLLRAQSGCPCDFAQPESLRQPQCSLCALAAKEPASTIIFFVHDNSPLKPNRWLALPRQQENGFETLAGLTPGIRTALWREAFARAQTLWGERWGLAYNGNRARSQCHVHIHIGRLIEGVEAGEFRVINGPEEVPVPDPTGLWIHPVGGKFHVHLGEQLNENVLLR